MLDTWIIAICIAGGCVLLAVLVLTIYKCCQTRKRKYNKRGTKGQNGHVWQAHSNEVELGDLEDPPEAENLKEDGLCKDTIAGSTFPRRIKAEDQNPKPRKKDGLCQDTEKGYTYPRRVKPEQDLLLPINIKNPSAFETALQSAFPVGVHVVTSFQRSNEENSVNDERLKSSNGVLYSTPKIKAQETACSDSEGSSVYDRNRSKNGLKNSIKKRREAKMKRAKSFNMGLEDLPEYGRPIKRSASTPSIIARKKVVRNDQRFETLKSIAPLPEPDYPLPLDESSTTLPSKYDDQDHAPPSYATSDSGVECLDAFSGHDEESLNNHDGVLESPGIPSSQLTPRDSNLFSSYKEHTSYNVSNETQHNDSSAIKNTKSYGFQSNLLAMASKDYRVFINANVVKDSISPSAVDEQDRFFQSTSKDNSTVINLPYKDPKMALRDTNNAVWKGSGSGSKNPNNSIKATERIQTTEEEVDFRSVKLRPTAKNYEESNVTNIYGVKQDDAVVSPLYQKENTQLTPIIQQNQRYIKTEIEDPSSNPTNHSITSGTNRPKDTYFLGFSNKPTVDKEHNEVQNYSPETEKRTDFHRIKLRQIPQSLKEHIAFREEMEPNLSVTQITPKHKDNVNSNTTSEENETTVSILDGIQKFQTQSVPGPKLSYDSHYMSKKDPVSKHVHTDSKEAVTNLKPVNIVTPEPLTIDIGIRKTTSTSTKLKDVNVVRKDPLMVQTNVTRPASVETVPSEDKRHFRYSTGKLNQNHATKEINASLKTHVLIREQDRQEKTNTVTSKHDLVEKPVAVVTPQSPITKRESPEERAALEEERKRNWKREQIEQKLSTAHIKSQNEQIFQASGLAYKLCMPELFSKIKQIGEEKEQSTMNN